jgi:hypothetical protein
MEKLKNFVIWLDGYLEDKTVLNEAETKKVSDRLNSLFQHEAEKESSIEFSHKPIPFGPGYKDPETGEVYRC